MLQKPFVVSIDNEDDLQLLREFYTIKLDKCMASIQQLTTETDKLKSIAGACQEQIKLIDSHTKAPDMQDISAVPAPVAKTKDLPQLVKDIEDVYSPGMTKAAQAVYALRKMGKPASTREILELLIATEPGLLKSSNTTFDKYQKALAATLYQKAVVKQTFRSSKGENGDAVRYSLIEWDGD